MKKRRHPLRRRILAIVLFSVALSAFGAMLVVTSTLDQSVVAFDLTHHFSMVQLVKLYVETSLPGPWSARDGALYRGGRAVLVGRALYDALGEYMSPGTRIELGTGAPPEAQAKFRRLAIESRPGRDPGGPADALVRLLDAPMATADGAYLVVRDDGGLPVGWIAISDEHSFNDRVGFRIRIFVLSAVAGFFVFIAGVLGVVVLRVTRPIDQIAAAHRAAAERNETLSLESRTDPLTGLLNRRGLFETLAEPRKEEPSHVAILDIDHFKAVNDKRGHEAGDIALTALASLLTSQVRAGDLCCRWGGEEFVIMLAGSKDADAAALAERVREAVAAMVISAGNDETAMTFGITVTIGVAAIEAGELREAIAAADRALYEGKRRGRNRVIGAFGT